jgi:hypothetical protein
MCSEMHAAPARMARASRRHSTHYPRYLLQQQSVGHAAVTGGGVTGRPHLIMGAAQAKEAEHGARISGERNNTRRGKNSHCELPGATRGEDLAPFCWWR